MLKIFLLSLGTVSIICLIFLLAYAPVKSKKMLLSKNNSLNPGVEKLLRMFGGDLNSILSPEFVKKRTKSPKLELLFKESNNPWKITPHEYFILSALYAILGAVFGIVTLFLFMFAGLPPFLGIAAVVGLPVIGYIIPYTVYNSAANYRKMKFKSELPEAIDFLIMAISGGGYSLPAAFEEATKYLKEGVIKDEFVQIVSDLRAGKTMEASLQSFGDRAPTDSIKAFVKALINANKLSVSMVEILRSRSRASRKELELEVEKRVTTLPTKVTLMLSPSSAAALILIAIAPSAYLISTML